MMDCGVSAQLGHNATQVEQKTGSRVCLSVRPEQISVARDESLLPPGSVVKAKVRVKNRIFLGEQIEYLLHDEQLGEFLVLSSRHNELSERPFEANEQVFMAWSRDAALILGGE